MNNFAIPLDVPYSKQHTYRTHLELITQNTGRLMLMAGDQKVEHLNDDFAGPHIAKDDADPEHLFRIASRARIGAFATQLGLIARYGPDYPGIPYLVKLNAKTNLIPAVDKDPQSLQWQTLEQVIRLRKEAGIQITGVGYTIYPGSHYEARMLTEAARLVFEAHQQGLLAVIWVYPRGQHVKNERDPHLIAGATGLAACLGADFAKVNPPEGDLSPLQEAVRAAGRTRVICAGGRESSAEDFLQHLHDQIHVAGTAGNATGRNIHQRPLEEAIRFTNAIAAITFDDAPVAKTISIYQG